MTDYLSNPEVIKLKQTLATILKIEQEVNEYEKLIQDFIQSNLSKLTDTAKTILKERLKLSLGVFVLNDLDIRDINLNLYKFYITQDLLVIVQYWDKYNDEDGFSFPLSYIYNPEEFEEYQKNIQQQILEKNSRNAEERKSKIQEKINKLQLELEQL